jgi:cytochrome c peroxidase
MTKPYMHAGSITTLDEVLVRHAGAGGAPDAAGEPRFADP